MFPLVLLVFYNLGPPPTTIVALFDSEIIPFNIHLTFTTESKRIIALLPT